MNADNHEQQPLIVELAAANCSVDYREETTKRVEPNESSTDSSDTLEHNNNNDDDDDDNSNSNNNNKPTSSPQQRQHSGRVGHSTFDKSNIAGGWQEQAPSVGGKPVSTFHDHDHDHDDELAREKWSRLSWLAGQSNDQPKSANQLKRQHHLNGAAAANKHPTNEQRQVEQTLADSNKVDESDAGARPLGSQVASTRTNRHSGGAKELKVHQREEEEEERHEIVATGANQELRIRRSHQECEASCLRATTQDHLHHHRHRHHHHHHHHQVASGPGTESPNSIGTGTSNSSSLLFWKFLSNLPTSITQRGKSPSGLAPEVAGYLANKQRQQRCDSNTMAPKTSSASTIEPIVGAGMDYTADTRPPPYDGCRHPSSDAHNRCQHYPASPSQQQEMVMMNFSGGHRAPVAATSSRVIRIVAPQPPGTAQMNESNAQQHPVERDCHQANPQSRDRLNQNPEAELNQQPQQHLQANRTKLSIASSRTTTRSSATSLSSCILSNSSGSEVVRLKWGKKMDFLLSIIGFAVDLANIWRFPYLVYKNGGGVFLIPYLTMLIFGGIPLFFLELCLGQFVKKGPITVWNKICPSMKGVGYCSIMISWYVSFYYNVLIAWSVYFIYRSLLSFGDKMPWEDCDNPWNSKGTCVSISQLKELCSHKNVSLEACRKDLFDNVNVTSPASEFFVKELSQIDQSTGLDDMGYLRWELVFCTMIVYLLHYLSLFRGLETSGKVVWVTATAPYMILSILLVRGLFLPGATMGIEYYLSPRLEKLADPQVWIDAAGQVFYSIGVGFGVHLTYASFNSHNNNCYRDCLMTSAVNAATSVYSGLVVFVYLGYMAKNLGIEIDKVASEGYSLVFEVYPEALTTLPFARFWSILFFIMLLTLGIDSAMGGLEAVITGLEDEFRFARRLSRGQLTGLVIVSSFLPALISCTQGGAYTLFWFDIYSAGVSLLFSALFETIGVVYCYGLNKFIPNIESMLGRKPPLFYIICWKYISPIFLGGVIFMSIYTAGVPTYRGYTFPLWSIILGWCLAFSSVAAIPIVAIWYWASRWYIGSSMDKSGRKRDRSSTGVAV